MKRWWLAAGVFGPTAVLSYTIQRLIDSLNEPAMGSILLQTHTPYYWRSATAGLHGLTLAVLVSLLVRDPEPWLNRLPVPTILAVLLSGIAMSLRP